MASPNDDKPNLSISKDDIYDSIIASSAFQDIQSWLSDFPVVDNDDYASDDFTSYDYQLDYDILDGHEFESLLAFLAPTENVDSASDSFSFDAIMENIYNCSKHNKRTEDDMIMDVFEMVFVVLSFGNIREAHLEKRVLDRVERIKEVSHWYKIPIRSVVGERIALEAHTLTFVRAITCYPYIATLLLHNAVRLAKNGAKSVLASEQLPNAMKHAGFPGLIPKGCDPYLMKAYMFAHAAYMVDFGKLINPDDDRSLKAMASSQLSFSKVGVEQVPFTDEVRVSYLREVGLDNAVVFKKIVDVCNNLCEVVGEPELTWEDAEKYHIKNNMVCFFEDDSKDVGASELTRNLLDKLKVSSIHDSFTSEI